MSAPSSRHLLRNRIAEALARTLNDRSHREIGRQLGIAGTTVGARGADLNSWPTSDLLELATQDETLGQALTAYLRGDGPLRGEPVALANDLRLELQDNNAVDAAVIANLDKSTPIGRQTIRAAIAMRRCHEEKLLADLDAMDGVRQ